MRQGKSEEVVPAWTFLSNHAHVLLLIAQDPEVTLREVADRVGITERAVQRIVADLEAAHYLERQRAGRRNHYKVHPELPLRHPVEAHRDVGALIALVMPSRGEEHAAPTGPPPGIPGEGIPAGPRREPKPKTPPTPAPRSRPKRRHTPPAGNRPVSRPHDTPPSATSRNLSN